MNEKEKYELLMKEPKSTIVRSFISLGNSYDNLTKEISQSNEEAKSKCQ